MLLAENLYKTYKTKERISFLKSKVKSVEAVKDISLSVKPGQIVGLLGINGAGKTSTIKILSGILSPDEGTVVMDDVDVIKNSMKVKSMVNLVSGGERNLYWRLSGRENLRYFGALYGLSRPIINKRTIELMDIVGLTDAIDTPVEKYSKGMKQRLQIARGLINNPRYLFLDEPTLGLDIMIAKEIRGYIRKMVSQQHKGAILTTHYIGEAEELCDYIYIIDNGSVLAKGTSAELKNLIPTGVQTAITLDRMDNDVKFSLDKLFANSTVDINYDENTVIISGSGFLLGDIIGKISAMSIKILELKHTEPKLEDALLKLVRGDSD